MEPVVGWVEEVPQTFLWTLNHGAVLMGLIRELHTIAALGEPLLLQPPRGQGQPWSPSSGHRCL